jgi:hypothetical protein
LENQDEKPTLAWLKAWAARVISAMRTNDIQLDNIHHVRWWAAKKILCRKERNV